MTINIQMIAICYSLTVTCYWLVMYEQIWSYFVMNGLVCFLWSCKVFYKFVRPTQLCTICACLCWFTLSLGGEYPLWVVTNLFWVDQLKPRWGNTTLLSKPQPQPQYNSRQPQLQLGLIRLWLFTPHPPHPRQELSSRSGVSAGQCNLKQSSQTILDVYPWLS